MPLTDNVFSVNQVTLDDHLCVIPAGVQEYLGQKGVASAVPFQSNHFILPRGRHYGRGAVILLGDTIQQIQADIIGTGSSSPSHTLKFTSDYGPPIEINKLAIVRIKALTGVPGERKSSQDFGNGTPAPETAFLVELADERYFGRYTAINKAYNLRTFNVYDENFISTYYESTTNGAPWSWGSVVNDLWNFLPGMFGALTNNGIYPDSDSINSHLIPENLIFRGISAWDALMCVLDATSNTIVRSRAGAYSIVSMSSTQTEGVETDANKHLAWHVTNDWFPSAFLPEKVRVFFPADYMAFQQFTDNEAVSGQDAFRLKPLYSKDVLTADNITNQQELKDCVVPGTVLPIHAPRCAKYDHMGSFLNVSVVNTFATQIATRYLKALEYKVSGVVSLHNIYHGYLEFLPGARVEAVSWHSGGNGSKTEVLLSPLEFNPKDRLGFLGETMLGEYLGYESTDPPDVARNHEPTERFCVVELDEDLECNGNSALCSICYGVPTTNFIDFPKTTKQWLVYNPSKQGYLEGERLFVFWHWQAHRFIVIGPAPPVIYRGKLKEDLCSGEATLEEPPTNTQCCSDSYPQAYDEYGNPTDTTAANPLALQGQEGDIVYLIRDCLEGGLSILNIQHHPEDFVTPDFENEDACVPELDDYGVPTGNTLPTGECKTTYKYKNIAAMTCMKTKSTRVLWAFQQVDVMIDWSIVGYTFVGLYQPIFVPCACTDYLDPIHEGTSCDQGSGSGP